MLTLAQRTVGTSAVQVGYVPAGPCAVVLSVAASSAVTVYFGTSSGVTTGSGFPVAGGAPPVTLPGFAGSGQVPLYAISSAASTAVGVAISTATGGTGP